MLSGIAAIALLSLTGPQEQQTPQPEPQPAQVDDIVVSGRRTADLVREFVAEVNGAPPSRGPARWEREICVGVVNLKNELAQAIVDRVSDVAVELGLGAGAPGCSPNILIIATDDGAALATSLTDARPRAFRPGYAMASLGRASLDRFKSNDRAIRWWHVAIPVHRDTGQIAVRVPGYAYPQFNTIGGLLRYDLQNDLQRAYIIVDVKKLGDVSGTQLADHLAMVALAEIDQNAEVAYHDTVLNLSSAAARNGLTAWDWSYLRSLYSAELNQRAPTHQIGTVSAVMINDWRRGETAVPNDD